MNISRSLLLGTASLAVCVAAADIVTMGTAMGATEQFTTSYPGVATYSDTPWDGTTQKASLPLFNSALGTLTGVTVELIESIKTFGSITNTGTSPATLGPNGYGESMNAGVFANGTPTPIYTLGGALVTAAATIVQIAASTTFSPGHQMTFGTAESPVLVSKTGGPKSLTPVSQYVGSGNTTFLLYANAFTTGGYSGGNMSITQTTTVNAQVIIDYSYTKSSSVPEPASMALLGTGLVGLGAMRRRGWRIAGGLDWLLHRRKQRGS